MAREHTCMGSAGVHLTGPGFEYPVSEENWGGFKEPPLRVVSHLVNRGFDACEFTLPNLSRATLKLCLRGVSACRYAVFLVHDGTVDRYTLDKDQCLLQASTNGQSPLRSKRWWRHRPSSVVLRKAWTRGYAVSPTSQTCIPTLTITTRSAAEEKWKTNEAFTRCLSGGKDVTACCREKKIE